MQLAAAHAPASEGEVAQALAGLDGAPGIWLGGDAGIPGLHPQQAVLVARPALILRPGTTGVTVQAHSSLGHGLLTQPAIAAWATASAPGAGRATLASLRAHMAVGTQTTFLFNDTARANIAYGRLDATDAEGE